MQWLLTIGIAIGVLVLINVLESIFYDVLVLALILVLWAGVVIVSYGLSKWILTSLIG